MPPAAFWNETPRSFVAIMEGAARAAKRRFEQDVTLAWHTAGFSGAAQAGKLKKLDHYLKTEKRAQTPDEMLETLQMMQKAGAPMSIREVN